MFNLKLETAFSTIIRSRLLAFLLPLLASSYGKQTDRSWDPKFGV
jgi:hypothetical protein